MPDLFSDLNPKSHAANRRKVASLYSMTNLVQMEPLVNECTELMVAKFADFARQGVLVDMGRWLQCYAFDVIGKITACICYLYYYYSRLTLVIFVAVEKIWLLGQRRRYRWYDECH